MKEGDSEATRFLERIRDGRTDLVFDYVEAGGAVDATDSGGTRPMQWCAFYGDVSAIRFLRMHGASFEDIGANLGLRAAVLNGHWKLCQYLLERGADARRVNPDTGENLLHDAMCSPTTSSMAFVVEVLLAHGTDPNEPTKPGAETAGFMRDVRTCGETPLHRAAAYGAPRVIEALLAAGANRETRDAHGDSPLTWASRALRPDHVLAKLCFGKHWISPALVQRSLKPSGEAEVVGMPLYLLGKPHLRLGADSGRRTQFIQEEPGGQCGVRGASIEG